MIVSNFELLTKRIATLPSNTPQNVLAPFRRVVQGYFLIVTSLNKTRTVKFRLKLTITTSTGNREINSTNTNAFFDNGGVDNFPIQITKSSSSTADATIYFTSSFNLKPNQTGLITILPFVNNFIFEQNPNVEIRGFVELQQVANGFRELINGAPATEVLINPETRGTFLDNSYPTQNLQDELDFDQISYSLQTASGKTFDTVEKLSPTLLGTPLPSSIVNVKDLQLLLRKNNAELSDDEIDRLAEIIEEMKDNKELKKFLKLS